MLNRIFPKAGSDGASLTVRRARVFAWHRFMFGTPGSPFAMTVDVVLATHRRWARMLKDGPASKADWHTVAAGPLTLAVGARQGWHPAQGVAVEYSPGTEGGVL
jgi:hypothetical protein